MRMLVPTFACLAVVAVAFATRRLWLPIAAPRLPITLMSQGPSVDRLQKLSHLVTMKVLVSDVLVGRGEGYAGAWLIKGDGLLGVDLSQAKVIAKDDATRKATIELPLPELIHSRVDHSRTCCWECRKTAWMPWSGDGDKLRDQVMLEAQKLVAEAASSREYIEQSKTATAAIIAGFFEEVDGWQVEVRWASDAPAAH